MENEPEDFAVVQPMPWSRNALGRLGKSLVLHGESRDGLPNYDEVMLWYNDLTAYLHQRIEAIDFSPILGEVVPEISSRSKTIDTLTEKLVRHPTYQLPNIQDISGARFECDMTLTQQTQVANLIAKVLSDVAVAEVKDYRVKAQSGYRAMHIWLTFPRLKARAEVQVRTHLQAAWANTYEQAADRFGRKIRYGGYPTDLTARTIVARLQQMSTADVARLESWQDSIDDNLKDSNSRRKRISRATLGADKRQMRRLRKNTDRLQARLEQTAARLYYAKERYTEGLLHMKESLQTLPRREGE